MSTSKTINTIYLQCDKIKTSFIPSFKPMFLKIILIIALSYTVNRFMTEDKIEH